MPSLPTAVCTPAGGSPRLPGRAGPHPVCRGWPDAGGGVPGRHICCSGHLLRWFAMQLFIVAHSGPAHLLLRFATQLCGAAHCGPACRRASRARPRATCQVHVHLACSSADSFHLSPSILPRRTPCPSPPTSCPMAAWSCCLRAARAVPTVPLRPRRRWPLARLSRCATMFLRGGQQQRRAWVWGLQADVVRPLASRLRQFISSMLAPAPVAALKLAPPLALLRRQPRIWQPHHHGLHPHLLATLSTPAASRLPCVPAAPAPRTATSTLWPTLTPHLWTWWPTPTPA